MIEEELMGRNVGSLDRGIRVVVGLGLLSLLFVLSGTAKWLGLIGIVPLGTAFIGVCPLYNLMGLSSCPLDPKK
jgi:hypothetical protein